MRSILTRNAGRCATFRTGSDVAVFVMLADVGGASRNVAIGWLGVIELLLPSREFFGKVLVEVTLNAFEQNDLSAASRRVGLLIGHSYAEEVIEAVVTVVMLTRDLPAIIGTEVVLTDDTVERCYFLRGLCWRCGWAADGLIVLQLLSPQRFWRS